MAPTLIEFRRDININIETSIEPNVATSPGMTRPVVPLDRLKPDTCSFIKLKLKKYRINFNRRNWNAVARINSLPVWFQRKKEEKKPTTGENGIPRLKNHSSEVLVFLRNV